MTSISKPAAIEARALVKSFGAVHAVGGIDLRLQPGETIAFLGPNRAGKTSTIDMVLALPDPDAGSIEVFGHRPRSTVSRGLVSAVLQTGGLLKDLTVRETVELTASLFTERRPVTEVLERAGISALADRRVGVCSGGEQQRLRFPVALVSDPALLILDEPTASDGFRALTRLERDVSLPARAVRDPTCPPVPPPPRTGPRPACWPPGSTRSTRGRRSDTGVHELHPHGDDRRRDRCAHRGLAAARARRRSRTA